MRIIILIITVLFSTLCFGQNETKKIKFSGTMPDEVLMRQGDSLKTTPIEKVDSLDIKIISMKELNALLERINNVALDNLSVRQKAAYDLILRELKTIYLEADKKRRVK